jgi:polyhydroxybutyrate depolymerase
VIGARGHRFLALWAAFALGSWALDLDAQELTPRGVSLEPGTNHRVWISVGDLRREYLVHIPPGYDGRRPVPVVLMLHGSGGSLDEIFNVTHWGLKSDDEGFLAVFPNGFPNDEGMRVWNDGRPAVEGRADDVAFARALLDDLGARFRIDVKRVFVVGFSNGAGLAYRLATELNDRIASIAPVAGRIRLPEPQLARPVPAIAIVGTEDGGYQADVRSAERWAALSGCKTTGDTVRNGRFVAVSYHACPKQVSITSYVVEGWEHYWPGGRNPGIEAWAEKVIWEFFRKHPLR